MSRRGIRHLLTWQVEVWRPTTTSDGSGGWTTTWVRIAAAQRTRLSQPYAYANETGAQSGADVTYHVYLEPSADVRRGDEIRTRDGQVLEVTAVVGPSVPMYLRADCTARQSEGEV